MKTIRDTTHFRNQNLKALIEALLIELNHERFFIPPVEPKFDLDSAGMVLNMSRRDLRDYLRLHKDRYTYQVNKFTRQAALTADDIRRLDEELHERVPADYDEKAKNLPNVKRRLRESGVGNSGDQPGGTGADGQGSI